MHSAKKKVCKKKEMKAEVTNVGGEEVVMRKIYATVTTAILISMMVTGIVTATTPEFNQNQDMTANVCNIPPVIIDGWLVILNQEGDEMWNQTLLGDGCDNIRQDAYCWESEKLVIWAIIEDENGESDLWEHEAQAYLFPDDMYVTNLAIRRFINADNTQALFKGECFVPDPTVWQCKHKLYITDVDKYGDPAINSPFDVYDELFINPEMSASFSPEDTVTWSALSPGDMDVMADYDPYIEHVYAQCWYDDQCVPVTVNYELRIHGTDLEGQGGISHVIPCENVEWKYDCLGWNIMTNGEVFIGQFITCVDLPFHFRIDVPSNIETGSYAGEIGFAIKAL